MNACKHVRKNNIMQILSAESRRESLFFCCRRMALSLSRTRQRQFQEQLGFILLTNTAEKLGYYQMETSKEKEAMLGPVWLILERQGRLNIWRSM